MWTPRPKWALLGAGLLLTFLLVLSVSLQTGRATSLRRNSPTTAVTITPATVIPTPPAIPPTPIPTLEAVSYPQMLAIYKEVLETSKSAVESSHNMLGRVVTWTTILFGILTAAGVGILWRIWKDVGELEARANEFRIDLEKTRKFNEELKNSAKEQEETLKERSKEVERLSASLVQLQEELLDTRKRASLVQSDLTPIVPRLQTLANVEVYAMRLFSTDREISRVAKRTLIELSRDEDPVVRRECVRVFGAMPDYPECFADLQDPLIISRLQQMALRDPERGVQLEARLALKKLGVDLGEE